MDNNGQKTLLTNLNKTDIRSFEYDGLKEWVSRMDLPLYRAEQIFSWLHDKRVSSFDEMTDLSKELRNTLKERCTLKSLTVRQVLTSKIDGTKKYLFELEDGNLIESVLMKYRHGNVVCVSSQVGCAMGCTFCASAIGGLVRNLSASEILGQVYEIRKDTKERISNVVIMGIGEPLANYNNVMSFIRILSHEKSLHISQRNITMSTCGIVPGIYRLAEESLKITLALSLHAPNDAIRRMIMPVAEKYSMEEILKACKHYFKMTGRRVSFEYCLIDKVNNLPAHARQLSKVLKGMNAHVNLIPVNPTPESNYGRVKEADIAVFGKILEGAGITVTVRRETGRDISGACGQLKYRAIY
ncbi:MAG: 23S rRNA (adenine(2503)-C(2))-methyltransferase RlmN [Lachnospiraceae bacterium]|jgi:23S rRNA (adenine2503-C2)-methyltransferase